MKRRNFIHLSTAAGLSISLPFTACKSTDAVTSASDYEQLVDRLLTTWTDALLRVQIHNPDDTTLHGALHCPACNKIHGRCMDAVYPLMYMADKTGDQKYLDAAIAVMEWSENVSMPDGSWTVIPNPKSWRGITVFGAIALGEALHHHGHILPHEIRAKWTERLRQAAEFVYQNFTMEYSHVNYAFTAVYALNFLGRMFEDENYIRRSRELAREVPNWLTKPNYLIYGEDSPADELSAKGLPPVDLGYNVEETLNGLVQFAVLEQDEQLLDLLQKSMEGHLEFMLPDGAWDNSWGTRQNKWTYWGSRTTDGCQPAFVLMADRNPAFGTAAYLNTELLERCTINGLLAGGLHYAAHDVDACVHHTFAHAKSLAFLLDNDFNLASINKDAPLPRQTANGIKHFPELDVWLASKGAWRGTVSTYDNIFKKPYSQAATGGALALLWHEKVGALFTASMAEYILVEKNNQQPQPDGEDIPLTPHIATSIGEQWYSNLYDLKATVATKEEENTAQLTALTQLTDRDRNVLPDSQFELRYHFTPEEFILSVKPISTQKATLVLPLLSPTGETVTQVNDQQIEIDKPKGKVVLRANVPLRIQKTARTRIFNMVPGMEAVPIVVELLEEQKEIVCKIQVLTD